MTARCVISGKKMGFGHAQNGQDHSHTGIASLCVTELGGHGWPWLGVAP